MSGADLDHRAAAEEVRRHTASMGVRAILEFDGDVVTLPDPAGGTFNAAGDFDRLLRFASALPLLSRIDEHGDVEFSYSELGSVRDEASSLLDLARDGAERRGLMRLVALASHGIRLPTSILRVAGD
jgi:hypothetical protein